MSADAGAADTSAADTSAADTGAADAGAAGAGADEPMLLLIWDPRHDIRKGNEAEVTRTHSPMRAHASFAQS